MRKILQRMWKYMIETIAAVNQAVNSFIWGIPAMVCIIGVGLLLSVRTGFCRSANSLTPSVPPWVGCSASGMPRTVP